MKTKVFGSFLLLACMTLAMLSGCRHAPDETRIRDAIAASSTAVEEGKPSAAVASLSEDFDGNAGQLDRRGLINLVRVTALRGQSIHALVGPTTVERRGERMVASFTVTLTAGTGLLPDQAGVYQVETGWRKDGGEWRCFTASWKKNV